MILGREGDSPGTCQVRTLLCVGALSPSVERWFPEGRAGGLCSLLQAQDLEHCRHTAGAQQVLVSEGTDLQQCRTHKASSLGTAATSGQMQGLWAVCLVPPDPHSRLALVPQSRSHPPLP